MRHERSIDSLSETEKRAHDPAVIDIQGGGKRPGAGLVLANFLHYDNTQRAVHALSTFTR